MKFLNYLDLAYQTFILGVVVTISVIGVIAGQLETIGMVALYGALLLGPWQMVSSVATCIARGLYFKWRLIHLITSTAFIVIFSAGAAFAKDLEPNGFVRTAGTVFGFAIPAALAGFYYFITVKSFQLARANARAV